MRISELTRARALAALSVVLLACFSERAAVTDSNSAELCGANPPANVVQIRNYAFTPAELQVDTGTRVTFVNCDDDVHTSTADAGAWDSPLLSPRGSYAHTFGTAGRFTYHCRPHPFMVGAVVVR
ncbi:hypothetical protein BH23GEM9_BH23GEM9_13140 [soil metagenome]